MVIIYGTKNCMYCTQLKVGLNKEGIQFMYKDIEEHKDEFKRLVERTQKELVPIVIVNKTILVPTIGFNSIAQAIELIISMK